MPSPTYLDNAATSHPKPPGVARAMVRALEVGGNPGRGGSGLEADRILFDTRMRIADFLTLPHPERVIFTRNATESLNLALFGLLKKGARVVTSALEHNSVIRPLAALSARGVRVVESRVDTNGFPHPAQLPEAEALVLTAGSNVTGALPNLNKICAAARRKGMLTIIDAAQSAGSIPLDLRNVDVLCCTGHKGLLGPQGIGFAWFAPGVEPTPLLYGGTGSNSEEREQPPFWPDRHEAGTVNTPGVAGLNGALVYLQRRGVAAIREKELAHCARLIEFFLNEPKISLLGPTDPADRVSLLSFTVQGRDPADIGERLAREGVAVRVGLHCAPSAHDFSGTLPEGGVRVSPGLFTTKRQIGHFIRSLRAILAKP